MKEFRLNLMFLEQKINCEKADMKIIAPRRQYMKRGGFVESYMIQTATLKKNINSNLDQYSSRN